MHGDVNNPGLYRTGWRAADQIALVDEAGAVSPEVMAAVERMCNMCNGTNVAQVFAPTGALGRVTT